MTNRAKLFLATLALITVTTTGCLDKATESLKDSPVGNRNESPADVMSFPDGYSNVASKCDGPNRVYVAFKGDSNRAAVSVVANDPRCAGAQ